MVAAFNFHPSCLYLLLLLDCRLCFSQFPFSVGVSRGPNTHLIDPLIGRHLNIVPTNTEFLIFGPLVDLTSLSTIIMDEFLLPSTTYESPARLARKHPLNTIIEDEFSEREECSGDEREANFRGRDQYLRPARSTSTSPVPSLTSSISSYYKSSHQSEDFDEMYDVSDDDSDISPSVMTSISTGSVDSSESPRSKMKQQRCPSLIIPSPSYWPTIQKAQTISPPRPPKIPISPAALSMLGHDLPSVSHPPSLDGSLNSDPLAGASAPVTPELQLYSRSGEIWGDAGSRQRNKAPRPELKIVIDDGTGWHNGSGFSPEEAISIRDFGMGVNRNFSDSPVLGSEDGYSEVGVQLPAEAMDTLRHLSLDTPTQEFASPTDSEKEMEEVDMALTLSRQARPLSADITPMSQTSEYSMSGLSIPSPGGFFSSLGSNARHTWSFVVPDARSEQIPPSSTTAEQFYNCPWNRDPSATVAHVIEIDDTDTDGPPTARQMPALPVTETPVYELSGPETPHSRDHDEGYEQALQEMAGKSLDRTSIWLAAQTSYMASLRDTYPASEVGLGNRNLKRASSHMRGDSLGSPIQKAVRFLESEVAKRAFTQPKKSSEGESIYYHAFQHIQAEQKRIDAFRHRHTRSGSVQTGRINLPHEHLEALQGSFQITHVERPDPKRPISMMPGKEEPEQTAEQKVIARVDRERQALEQVNARMWVVEAAKYLSGGKLLNSPAAKGLTKPQALDDVENGTVRNPSRVLDLGGQPNGDWAWHASREYQYARIYTASVEQNLVDSGIRGPRNHRRVAVTELWQLPYPDNYFDAISARSLFTFLKAERPLGQTADEYDLCLQECLRCLKPGGYLEWFMMDSELVNAGTRGTAVSVEFGFNLKTRGYDPVPTKSWLGRVRRAGFDDIKRAWTFLPMGTSTKDPQVLPETPPPDISTFETEKLEAVQGPVGSTADAAMMSGLVGSWAWEQWMVRLETEMGKEESHMLEGVAAVMEEGKTTGAGWRCLTGWARKPGGQ